MELDMNGLVAAAIQLFSLVLLARIILSWIQIVPPHHPISQTLHQITEPVLEPVRRIIPPLGGGLDISPLVVLIGLRVLQGFILGAGG